MNALFDIRRVSFVFLSLLMLAVLPGCFWESDDPAPAPVPTPDANPTGYYGNGTISEITAASDFQALIYNNRIILFSWSKELTYDGDITITENNYTATVKVYKEGVKVTDAATITGTITEGSTIEGKITGTTGDLYNGTLLIDYADNNGDSAMISKVKALSVSGSPLGIFTELLNSVDISVDDAGTITHFTASATSYLASCKSSSGTIKEIPGTNLYHFTIVFLGCTDNEAVNGTYTGLGTTKTDTFADDRFVVGFTNGSYSVIGDFE